MSDQTQPKFIDYLSLVEPPRNQSAETHQALHQVASSLRELARQSDIIIVTKTQH